MCITFGILQPCFWLYLFVKGTANYENVYNKKDNAAIRFRFNGGQYLAKQHKFMFLAPGAAVPCSKLRSYAAKRTSETREQASLFAPVLRF